MKFLGIMTAASLALAPVFASAEPASSVTYDRPAPGPVASQATDEMDTTGLVVAAGVGALGLGLLIALSSDGDDTTTTTTTTTTTD